jgi:flagellar biosynthesis/type III secretory pathway protein FliH
MPRMVEVDEAEILEARRMREVLGKIAADPKRKARLEMLHKEVDPNVPTPTNDQFKPVEDAVLKMNETVEALRKERAEEKAAAEAERKLSAITNQVESGIARLKQEGWMEEGITKVKAIMEEKGLLDVDDAVAIFERRNPPAAPIAPSGSGAWNFMDAASEGVDADIKKLIETKGESEPLLNKMVNQSLMEIRGSARR